MNEPVLSEFEILVLTAFYRPMSDAWHKIRGPELRDERKSAIERLTALDLLDEEAPFVFRISHAGHTFLDQRGK